MVSRLFAIFTSASPSDGILRRFALGGVVFALVLTVGTVGYYIIAEGEASVLDCLYMTVVTVLTIGYEEVVELDHRPGGRIFTIVIAFTGVAIVTYMLSNLAALIIEGDLRNSLRQRHMDNRIRQLTDHYIVCGAGRVGRNILAELAQTRRLTVVLDRSEDALKALTQHHPDLLYQVADATDEDALLAAGLLRAAGVFVALNDDNDNLVACLTAKLLQPDARIVVRCNEHKNEVKMYKAGATAVVSPTGIGGVKMVNDMVRPVATSFLNTVMLSDASPYRLEEVLLNPAYAGATLADLGLERFAETIPMAIRTRGHWVYFPKAHTRLPEQAVLVVFTSAREREELQRELGHRIA